MITRRMVDITALLLVKAGVTRGGQRLVDGLITALGSLVSTGRDLQCRLTRPASDRPHSSSRRVKTSSFTLDLKQQGHPAQIKIGVFLQVVNGQRQGSFFGGRFWRFSRFLFHGVVSVYLYIVVHDGTSF